MTQSIRPLAHRYFKTASCRRDGARGMNLQKRGKRRVACEPTMEYSATPRCGGSDTSKIQDQTYPEHLGSIYRVSNSHRTCARLTETAFKKFIWNCNKKKMFCVPFQWHQFQIPHESSGHKLTNQMRYRIMQVVERSQVISGDAE